MSAPFHAVRRGVVVLLVSGAVGWSAGLTGGLVQASADPVTEPIITTPVPQPAVQPPPAAVPDIPPPAARQAPVIPQTPPAVELPPPTRAPVVVPPPAEVFKPAPVVTPEPPAVQTTVANPPATTAEAPKPRYTAPSPTEPAPVSTPAQSPPSPALTTPAQSPANLAPATAPAQSPANSAPATPPGRSPASLAPATTSTPATTSAGPTTAASVPSTSTPSTGPSQAPAERGASTAPTSESSEAGAEPGPSGPKRPSTATDSAVPSASSISSQALQAISAPQPEKVQAPQQDVELAKASRPIEQRPDPAPRRDVDELWKVIRPPNPIGDGRDPGQEWSNRDRPYRDGEWDHRVRQWDRHWVQYDQYYRPVICNPYRDVLRVVYIYQGAPRIVFIQPLGSIAVEAAVYGAYNFTAVLLNAVGTAVNVAVGSFFGGGYYPGLGLPLPPPPRPVVYYDNVPVVVKYRRAAYQPFLVSRIVDAGDDAHYGERKVLLDGVTPAWGVWTQTDTGQRQFEVHKTQQFPGLDNPQEAPLPGDYQLKLAGDTSSAGFSARDVYAIATAVAVGSLILGAAGVHIFRRRPGRLH
jgi:hypothetical protein